MKDIQVLKKELIEKAMHCKNAEELMALAESEGISLTKEEAEAYLAEMEDVELNVKNCTVREALGKTALKRSDAAVTVTGVKSAGIFETVYDVLVGEEADEDVIFVAGIAAEGYFTQGERSQGGAGENRRMSRFIVFDCISNFG